MDTNTIFILISTVMAILASCLSMYLTYKNSKEISRRAIEAETKAVLSFQRERQENIVYDAQDRLLATPVRFTESNHLFFEYDEKIHLSNKVYDNSFFQNLGLNPNELYVKENKIMCLMPFHERFEKTRRHLQSTCESEGFDFVRSDDKFETGNILRHIVKNLLEAQIIIALLDGKSPNVTYEVGIANALGKPVILVAKLSQKNQIPFDLKTERFILYKTYVDLDKNLKDVLNNLKKK